MRRLYEYVALWFGLGLIGTLSLTWSLLAAALYYLLPKRWSHPLGRWATTAVFRVYLGALALVDACRFDIRELDALRAEGPLVIAPNHPCLLDALMVISRLSNLTCVMKADIVDNIFLGGGARLAGYIRNDAQLSMIRQAVAALKGGSHLLLFPEGTRTTTNPVNPFKGSIGLIAHHANVPVQTILIETDSLYLSKGWSLFRKPPMPIHYRVRLGKRFDPPQHAQRFMAELEHYFAHELIQGSAFYPAYSLPTQADRVPDLTSHTPS